MTTTELHKRFEVDFGDDDQVEIKKTLRLLILNDRDISVDDLDQELRARDINLTRFTLTHLRTEFRMTLKLLESEGWLRSKPKKPKKVETDTSTSEVHPNRYGIGE